MVNLYIQTFDYFLHTTIHAAFMQKLKVQPRSKIMKNKVVLFIKSTHFLINF